jgi:large subunit ribosomal protein L20
LDKTIFGQKNQENRKGNPENGLLFLNLNQKKLKNYMVRVKRGVIAHKRRKNLLKHAKGFMWGRKSKYKAAKEALFHAWAYAYRDRRRKKRDFRALWQTQINAASRAEGMPYNKFIAGLKKHNIGLDRKILSELARKEPEIFKKIVEKAKS